MSKIPSLVFFLILIIVSGCETSPPQRAMSGSEAIAMAMNEPSYIRTMQDIDKNKSQMDAWSQESEKNLQDVNNCKAEIKTIVEQEMSLLNSLETEKQRNLYSDFLLFFQSADDQTKVYEFLEKLQAALPADKMKTVKELYLQIKRNEYELDRLQKQRETLNLKAQEIIRENETIRRGLEN